MSVDRLLAGRRVLLGVSGGVAAYKAAMVASRLTQAGALVDVVLTESATRFVTPLTFESVTRRRAFVDMFSLPPEAGADARPGDLMIPHVALARAADLMIVAPATANTLAKLAHGVADNLLTAVALAVTAPLLLAPAMESHMWEHSATQANLTTLTARGASTVGPASGHLASGASGVGRMSEPEEIVAAARLLLAANGDLAGRTVVVSAGGTREAIDPVRFIGNRSSGKMGYALATAARERGARVTLVAAPSALPDPAGIELVRVESAQQMRDAVMAALERENIDALVMAAAVADYQPEVTRAHKIKKSSDRLTLELVRTPDILAEVADLRVSGRGPRVVVGFAAETEDLLDNARVKLQRKRLDMVVANDVNAPDAGFAADTNRVSLLWPDGAAESLPLMSKDDVAHAVWDRIVKLL